MFWKKKDKKPAAPAKPTREQLIAQAKQNMAAARTEIGDETLEKIRDAIMKKQSSAFAQAKAKIDAMDRDKFHDSIKFMMREEK